MIKKVWDFLWKSNTVLSWIVCILLIFLIIRFIIFPVSGLILGTSMPFVIVESGSMHHEGNLSEWWAIHSDWYEKNDIDLFEIEDYWNFKNGLNKGDIIIIKGSKDYKKGEIIIFKIQEKNTPIIHRIVDTERLDGKLTYSTKGDHNDGQLLQELIITKEQVVGKAIGRIPGVGWIKLFFVELFK